MKKTLIALAVLAASSASMAQVTLYGVADIALGAVSAKSYTNAAGVVVPATDDKLNMQTNGGTTGNFNDGNSRWGIKVVEDLGSGLKATAQFEQNIDYSTGATGTADARYAYLALDGGFGRVKAGRTLSPSFFGVAAWEITGTANFSAVGGQFGFAGAGSRNSREFSYTTPNMGGFSATLGYVTELDGIENGGLGSKLDANAIYSGGPLAVGLSYWKNDKVAAGASSDGNYALGASYNFGGFILAGSWQDAAGDTQGFSLGASVPVGQWKFAVDVAQDTAYEDTDFVLYAGYSLSKRTTLYTDFRRDGKSGKTAKSAAGVTGLKTGVDSDTYGVGIRMNF
ncbi:MAG: porin [Pseudomonadota bacterium]